MTETNGPHSEGNGSAAPEPATEGPAALAAEAMIAPAPKAPPRRRGALAGALLGFALIVGLFLFLSPPPPPGPEAVETAAVTPPAPAPASPLPVAPEPPAPAPAVAPPPPPPPAPLRFDTVRVEPSGAAAVAGAAPSGARLILRLDGAPVAEGEANANGDFALLFDLPPAAAVQILTLEAELPGGTRRASAEQIALAPRQVAAPAVGQPPPPPPLLLGTDGPRPAVPSPAPGAGGAPYVALELIAQERGRLTVAGQAEGGVALRLYLDDAPAREMALAVPGPWRLALPPATEGAHRLRADLLDAAGKVIARAEQSFTQLPEPAASPPEPVLVPLVQSSTSALPPPPEPAPRALLPASETPPPPEPAPLPNSALPPLPAPAPPVITLKVEKGFTLWQIAAEQLGDPYLYVQIFAENRDQIRNPDLIYPGQVFTLPPAP